MFNIYDGDPKDYPYNLKYSHRAGYGDATDDYYRMNPAGYVKGTEWVPARGFLPAGTLGDTGYGAELEADVLSQVTDATRRGFLETLMQGGKSVLQGASDYIDDLLRKENEPYQGPGKPFPRDLDKAVY